MAYKKPDTLLGPEQGAKAGFSGFLPPEVETPGYEKPKSLKGLKRPIFWGDAFSVVMPSHAHGI